LCPLPGQIDAKACNKAGCKAIIRYSFATQKEYDAYQVRGVRVVLLGKYCQSTCLLLIEVPLSTHE
jgi:hypothetical protein